jgi:glycosyltransferase involved in cell wall biosynthesis
MNRRPRAAMIVLNQVTNDSRVLKGAWYMADKGWDVVIFGWAPKSDVEHLDVGRADIVRIPRPANRSDGNRIVRIARRDFDKLRNRARQAWIMSIGQIIPGPSSEILRPIGLAKIAMTDAIADFEPDLIHAQDFSALPVALSASRKIVSRGGAKPPMIYDAHEFLPGQANIKRAIRRSLVAMERAVIKQFHAVVTVSPKIAEMLQQNHNLDALPIVVQNDPVLAASRIHPSDIRKDLGLAPEIPLMVYSGGIAPQRGIMVAVKSLPQLPGHHLAIMAPGENAHLLQLLAKADELNVKDRVHVLPFVSNAEVTSYLKSADIGLIMNTHHVNHELSTPTKFSEYAHANIPIVVSDVKYLAAETRRIGMGEVFISEDVVSFVEAVLKVTAEKAKYISAYKADFLQERSWEAQCEHLVPLYERLTGLHGEASTPSVFKVDEPQSKPKTMNFKEFYAKFLSANTTS